ncbi:MAG TPA: CPBP family intramembrane metalloprotease [Candidatus Dwaynia gallinarum]|nr:CPBP family intramembrane metalloprotease [Candidatus Dwaynia gallinarum]
MSNFNDIEFVSETYRESKFKPRFYVVFLIVFSMYYFFSPILSHFIFLIVKGNIKIVESNFLYQLFEKFFIPYVSIFLILIIYIFLIEERRISFLFSGVKNNFLAFNIKGIIFSTLFLFVLIFVFILRDYTLSFKLNREFTFLNLFQLLFVFIFTYIKFFFLECLYRGWLFNIFTSRYSIIASLILTSIVPVVIGFIEYQRIGIYLIYMFLFNIFLSLMFVVYKNIFILISFNCFYDFLKKYILSLESMNVKLEPLFYTVINNTELYNVENNYYSLIVLTIVIVIMFIFYKCKFKM